MTTFVPPELIRSTGNLTVERVFITPLTNAIADLDIGGDRSSGNLARVNFVGEDSATNTETYARLTAKVIDDTATTEDGALDVTTIINGSLGVRATFGDGIYMPGATDGDKGAGTINATQLYVNGVAVGAGVGDVVGPGSATDNTIPRFDTTTGKLIQGSGVTINDSNSITGVQDLTLAGDLTVNGTTTTVGTTTLAVTDPLIQLAKDNNTTDSIDIGFVGLYDTSGSLDLYCGLFRDASDGKFKAFIDSQEDLSTSTTVNTAATGYTMGTIVANIEGGTISGSNLSGTNTGDEVAATTTVAGIVEQATQAETDTGTDTDRYITPATLSNSTNLLQATTTQRGAIEIADASEISAGTSTDRAVTPAQLATTTNLLQATTSQRGAVELANQTEVNTGTDAVRAVTPATLANATNLIQSTSAQRGIIELANQTEVNAGTDTVRAITPATLAAATSLIQATLSQRGIIELATQTEVNAGTDAVRAVTPATLAAYSGLEQSWSTATRVTTSDYTEGVSTSLTLPAASPSDDEDNVRVHFNGIKQHATEWNISGTTITFTTAIPVGVTAIELQVLS